MAEQIKHRPRVLVADDDVSIRQLVCTIVKREDVDVDSASDGAEAIQLLEEHEYSVILLDLMMPRVDGFGVVAHLAAHPPALKPVLLVMTAYADHTFRELDTEIVAGVLRKPFEVSELSNVIRLCVNGSDQIAEKLLQAKDRSIRDFAQKHAARKSLCSSPDRGNINGKGASGQ